jgi:hypothetical protein
MFCKIKRNFLRKLVFFMPVIFINKILFLDIRKDFSKKESKLIWYLNKND